MLMTRVKKAQDTLRPPTCARVFVRSPRQSWGGHPTFAQGDALAAGVAKDQSEARLLALPSQGLLWGALSGPDELSIDHCGG
nr:unnamed protein product [Homo sapiens]